MKIANELKEHNSGAFMQKQGNRGFNYIEDKD
jgi:hypothetical protein